MCLLSVQSTSLTLAHEKTWTVAAAGGVRCARVRREINFLLTFETAPFFCVHSVLLKEQSDCGRKLCYKLKKNHPLYV